MRSALTFPLMGSSDHNVVSVPPAIVFNLDEEGPFYLRFWSFLFAVVFVIISEIFQRRISITKVLLLVLNFVSSFRMKLLIYPLQKVSCKASVSPCFTEVHASDIVYRYHFFCFFTRFLLFFCFLFLNGEDKIIGRKWKIRGDGHIHDHHFVFHIFRGKFFFSFTNKLSYYTLWVLFSKQYRLFNLHEQQNVMLSNNYLYVTSTISLFFIISAVFLSCSFWWTFF